MSNQILEFTNKLFCGDNIPIMQQLPSEIVDVTITSPPYDELRDYDGYSFDFPNTAKELLRLTKPGGVVVWVVGDSTLEFNESGTSFKQALYFKEIGFNLYDTMIYQKRGRTFPRINYYYPAFEYMFIFSKGRPKTINLIADRKNKDLAKERLTTTRQKDGSTQSRTIQLRPFSVRDNIWIYDTGYMKTTKDEEAYDHPAMFPEALVKDHLISWSKDNDLIFDPFAGSGTTLKMSKILNRNYLGIEKSEKYCSIITKRLAKYDNHKLDSFTK